jgi:DNA invertase Pin-like site-specific DNA recombinase
VYSCCITHYNIVVCSMRCMAELTVRQARELLTAWAADQAAVASRRDDVVLAALAAGVSKSEVHRLTGIARTTVDRIAERAPSAGGGAAA